MKEIANFIPHCDNDHCDLGSFQYKCPKCGCNNVDFDMWWKIDELHHGSVIDLNCEFCKEALISYYDEVTDFCYYVQIMVSYQTDHNVVDPG